MDIKIISEDLVKNSLKESATFSTDVARAPQLIEKLNKKLFPDSLVSKIATIKPSNSPIALVPYLFSEYTGDRSNYINDIHLSNSRIITFDISADPLFSVGNQYSSGADSFTVFYKEISSEYASGGTFPNFPNKFVHLLVRVDSGIVQAGSVFNGKTVLYSSQNRNIIKRVFKNYGNVLENNSNLLEVNFQTSTFTLEAKTKKIATSFSQEKIEDLFNLYGEKAEDIITDQISKEINSEIDMEVLAYLKNIASPMPHDVILYNSLARTGGDLSGVAYDVYFAIFQSIEEIARKTKRKRDMFIVADSSTCALLCLSPMFTRNHEEKHSLYIGTIGNYPLYSDPYSTENYVLVGYKTNEEHSKDFDGGLIFVPYSNIISVETTDPDSFQKRYITLSRYSYRRHPEDLGDGSLTGGVGNSIFFKYIAVDFSSLGSISNLSDQITRFV